MKKDSMTIEQRSKRSLLVAMLRDAGWTSTLAEEVFESGVDVKPEAIYEYNNKYALLSLEYHAKESFLLFALMPRNKDDQVVFRFYFEHNLEALLKTIIANQSELSAHSYPRIIRQVCAVCNEVFMDLEGEPAFKVEIDNVTTDEDENERATDEIEDIYSEEEKANFSDRYLDEVEDVLDGSIALSRFTQQHLRIAVLVKKALKIEANATLPLLDTKTLLKNSCEWIEQKRCALIVLMPTHDSPRRKPDKGNAYFDPTVKYPDTEGTYPGDESVKVSPHLVYANENALGGLVENDDKIEIFNADKLSDKELQRFVVENVGKLVFRLWGKYHSELLDDTVDLSKVQVNGNLIHSLRIQDLADQLMSMKADKNSAVLKYGDFVKQIQALDEIDFKYLYDEVLAKSFWSVVQKKVPGSMYEQLRNDIVKLYDLKTSS
jgi:hypothetical protein